MTRNESSERIGSRPTRSPFQEMVDRNRQEELEALHRRINPPLIVGEDSIGEISLGPGSITAAPTDRWYGDTISAPPRPRPITATEIRERELRERDRARDILRGSHIVPSFTGIDEAADMPSSDSSAAISYLGSRLRETVRSPWLTENSVRGASMAEFTLDSYHVTHTVPEVDMNRLAASNDILISASMEIAGKLNNCMVQHLVEACSTEDLMSFKRSIIDEIKKRNTGESHDPTLTDDGTITNDNSTGTTSTEPIDWFDSLRN